MSDAIDVKDERQEVQEEAGDDEVRWTEAIKTIFAKLFS